MKKTKIEKKIDAGEKSIESFQLAIPLNFTVEGVKEHGSHHRAWEGLRIGGSAHGGEKPKGKAAAG